MGSYHKIYDIQRQLLVFFYLFFCLSIIIPAGLLIHNFFDLHWGIYLVSTIVYLVLSVYVGSYLFVITLLPTKLMRGFDNIKNNIAEGSISTDKQFANAVNSFSIEYFNYLFFDIAQSAFYIRQTGNVFYSDNFQKSVIKDWDSLIEESSKNTNVIYKGKLKTEAGYLYSYMVPVWFGDQPLGYMLFCTSKKLSSFFIGILHDFESLYIDDQLLHIVNRIKAK